MLHRHVIQRVKSYRVSSADTKLVIVWRLLLIRLHLHGRKASALCLVRRP